MRSEEDILQFRVKMLCGVSLDMERIEEDPQWEFLTRALDMSNAEIKKAAVETYLAKYISQEILLTNMPSTNGPASLYGTEIEWVEKGKT